MTTAQGDSLTTTSPSIADFYSSAAIKQRLDTNIGDLAVAISDLMALSPETDIDELSRRLGWIACHARNTASACGDLRSARREEARR